MSVERFVIADEESSLWGHLFGPGRDETIARFVFDREQMALVAADFQTGSAWEPMMADMLDGFLDHIVNANPDAITAPESWDLRTSNELPDWVRAGTHTPMPC